MPNTFWNSAMANIYLHSVKDSTMIYKVWGEKNKRIQRNKNSNSIKIDLAELSWLSSSHITLKYNLYLSPSTGYFHIN